MQTVLAFIAVLASASAVYSGCAGYATCSVSDVATIKRIVLCDNGNYYVKVEAFVLRFLPIRIPASSAVCTYGSFIHVSWGVAGFTMGENSLFSVADSSQVTFESGRVSFGDSSTVKLGQYTLFLTRGQWTCGSRFNFTMQEQGFFFLNDYSSIIAGDSVDVKMDVLAVLEVGPFSTLTIGDGCGISIGSSAKLLVSQGGGLEVGSYSNVKVGARAGFVSLGSMKFGQNLRIDMRDYSNFATNNGNASVTTGDSVGINMGKSAFFIANGSMTLGAGFALTMNDNSMLTTTQGSATLVAGQNVKTTTSKWATFNISGLVETGNSVEIVIGEHGQLYVASNVQIYDGAKINMNRFASLVALGAMTFGKSSCLTMDDNSVFSTTLDSSSLRAGQNLQIVLAKLASFESAGTVAIDDDATFSLEERAHVNMTSCASLKLSDSSAITLSTDCNLFIGGNVTVGRNTSLRLEENAKVTVGQTDETVNPSYPMGLSKQQSPKPTTKLNIANSVLLEIGQQSTFFVAIGTGMEVGAASKIRIGRSGQFESFGAVSFGKAFALTMVQYCEFIAYPGANVQAGDNTILTMGKWASVELSANMTFGENVNITLGKHAQLVVEKYGSLRITGVVNSLSLIVPDLASLTVKTGADCIVYGPPKVIKESDRVVWYSGYHEEYVDCKSTSKYQQNPTKASKTEAMTV